MQYRKDTFHNIYIRLNDDGSMLMIKTENHSIDGKRISRVWTDKNIDWDMIYNSYQRSNKREFDEAEENAQI